MGNTFFFGWEVKVTEWLQSFENGFLTALAKLFTFFGEEYLLILVLGTVYWCISKDLGRKVSLAMSGSMISGSLLKGVTLRRRPYMDNETIKCIRAPHPEEDISSPLEQGFSMPSLHAAMSSAVYGTIGWNVKKKVTTFLAFFMPFFIGLSRVYLGVHYSTDVLSGWALGIISVFLFGAIEKKYGYKIGFAVVLITGAAGFFFCHDIDFYSLYGVTLGMLIGFWFEEKFVNFHKAEKWWQYIVRPVLGVCVFLVISKSLKLAVMGFSLEETSVFMLYYRLFRYTLATSVTVGVYPMVFKLVKKKSFSRDDG